MLLLVHFVRLTDLYSVLKIIAKTGTNLSSFKNEKKSHHGRALLLLGKNGAEITLN